MNFMKVPNIASLIFFLLFGVVAIIETTTASHLSTANKFTCGIRIEMPVDAWGAWDAWYSETNSPDLKFTISLTCRPDYDVTIPIRSTMPSVGSPTVESITFTPDNYEDHAIEIKGKYLETLNTNEEYKIILGVAQSKDQNYAGMDPEDVVVKGSSLTIRDSLNVAYLVSGNLQRVIPDYLSVGQSIHARSLFSGPPGSYLDDRILQWKPGSDDEGKTFEAEIATSYHRGRLTYIKPVRLKVAQSKSVEYERLSDDTFKVVDNSSSLKDFIISFGGLNPTNLQIREVLEENMPPLPSVYSFRTKGFYAVYDESRHAFKSGSYVKPQINVPVNIIQKISDEKHLKYYSISETYHAYWSGGPHAYLEINPTETVMNIILFGSNRIFRINEEKYYRFTGSIGLKHLNAIIIDKDRKMSTTRKIEIAIELIILLFITILFTVVMVTIYKVVRRLIPTR